MRKIYSFMVAAVATFAAISCTQELDNNVPVGDVVTYEASVDGADSKAILDGVVSKWSGEELITIHDGNKGFTFYTNATEPTTKATFTYEGDDFTASEVMAVYPSGNYGANIAEKTVSGITIPETQSLVDGTYPATATVAVAHSTNKSLSFKNATTLLKFKVASDDITYGCILTEGNISGTFDLNYNDHNPSLTATDAKQWVDFNKGDESLSKEAYYYVAVAPAELNKLTVYLNGTEVKSKTFEDPYKLNRNVILDLGTLSLPEVSQNWSVTGTFNEWGDADMTLEGDWFVAKNLTITTSDRFKFRADHQWAQNRGTSEKVSQNNEYAVTAGGDDICVSASAIYNVYLSKDTYKMKIEKVGDYVDPNPEPDSNVRVIYFNPGGSGLWDQAGAWFQAWTWGGSSADAWITFEKKDGVYSAEIPKDRTGMKVLRKSSSHAANNWDKWNNTGDVTIPSDKNTLTITGWGENDWEWSNQE